MLPEDTARVIGSLGRARHLGLPVSERKAKRAAMPGCMASTGVTRLNQLTTVGRVSAGHDARGNVTTDPTTGNSYGYSSENLLTSGTAGAGSYALSYDPLTRLASISGAPATGFGYDGLGIIPGTPPIPGTQY